MADEEEKMKKTKMKTKKAKSSNSSARVPVPGDSDLLKAKPKKEVKVKAEAESPKGRKEVQVSFANARKEHVKPKMTPRVVRVKQEEQVRNADGNGNIKKKKKEEQEGQRADDTSGKKQRKVYDLLGQKHDPPQERDPLRIFYQSLFEQRPASKMAQFWMMEHGLLSPEWAKKIFEKKQRKQQQLKVGTPLKSSLKKDYQNSEKKSSAKDASKLSSTLKKKGVHEFDGDSDDELIMPKKKLRMSS